MDNGNDGTAMGRYWSEDADNYDGIVRSELKSFRASAWSAFFERRLNPASRVLDFGCGPGEPGPPFGGPGFLHQKSSVSPRVSRVL